MTDADKIMNPQHFRSNPADSWIQISPEIQVEVLDHFWLTLWLWRSLCCPSAVVVHCSCTDDVLLQLRVMKTNLDVIERMFRVHCGVMVVDTHLCQWLKLILDA